MKLYRNTINNLYDGVWHLNAPEFVTVMSILNFWKKLFRNYSCATLRSIINFDLESCQIAQ